MIHYTVETEKVDNNNNSKKGETFVLAAGPIIKSHGTVARRPVVRYTPGSCTPYVVHWQCWNEIEVKEEFYYHDGCYKATFADACKEFARRCQDSANDAI